MAKCKVTVKQGAAPEPTEEDLRAENGALRTRVAELTSALRAVEGELAREEARAQVLSSVVENAPSVIFVKDAEGRCVLVNRRFEELMGVPRAAVLGRLDDEVFPPAQAAVVRAKDLAIMSAGEVVEYEEVLPIQGSERTFFTSKFPIRAEGGEVAGICGITSDITERKREEEERAALREQVIEAQRLVLRELSTPLLPIAPGVVVMPLVGAIDRERAGQILEGLLAGVASYRAHTAILDITGVRELTAEVASGLMAAARAARLLGARVALTGTRPEVAQTLVELGVDLGGIVTLSTLERGIAYALRG